MNNIELKGLSWPILNNNNEWTGEFENSDPIKPPIKIKDIHIDSSSDMFDSTKEYVGLIIYLCGGKSEFTLKNVRCQKNVHCQTGDIYIKDSKWILENTKTRNGRGKYVHGRLFYSIFGFWRKKELEFVAGGFSYYNGEWKYHSRALNTMNPNNNDDGYHNTNKGLNQFEVRLIKSVCNKLYENHQWKERSHEARVSIKLLVDMRPKIDANRKYYGIVKWVNYRKGYGFIECDHFREDIFVHCSGVLDRPTKGHFLDKDDHVEFNVIKRRQGLEATNVTINGYD